MTKRKHDNTPQDSQKGMGRRPTKTGYLGDPKLLPRVRQYLSLNKSKRVINVASMVDDLRKNYGEYYRKKRSAFFNSVTKAYQMLCEESSEEDVTSQDEASALEAAHTTKKKRSENTDGADTGDSEDASFSSENPDYVAYDDGNSVNRFLTDMYKDSPKRTVNQTPLMQPVAEKSMSYTPPVIPPVDRSNSESCAADGSQLEESIPVEVGSSAHGDLDTSKQSEGRSKTQHARGREDSTRKRMVKKAADKEKKGIQVQTSTVTFADVGGNEASLKELCKLLVHMRHPEVYRALGVTPPRGFLLHGPPGCGKTLLANAIAGELELPFIKLSAPELISGVSGESEEKIRDLFDKAMACAPSIVFIDEIDSITPKRETASKDMERRVVAQLLTCLDDLSSKSVAHVLVIGASNRPDALDPALRRAGRFDREISLGIPDETARGRILAVLSKNLQLCEDFDFSALAKVTPGYVGADLMALTREAAMTAVNRVFNDLKSVHVHDGDQGQTTDESEPVKKSVVTGDASLESLLNWLKAQPPFTEDQLRDLSISMDDFKSALQFVQPSAKREGFATVPDVTWDDIGALQSVRQELKLAILAPIHHREDFKALGLTSPPGILLAGPPGCGKTLLAKAIANESGINFISVKGPELLNMYVGESERAVRQVFQRARNSAPCVIFFDELDALCPRRSHSGEGGSSVRVVNQLLTEMDGLEERKQVFIMGATNRPDIIDPAILRPGRLDKILYVGLPTQAERLDILNTITKAGSRPPLAEDISLESVAGKCEGFTGADLAAVVREASMAALKERIDSSEPSAGDITVFSRHFDVALCKVKPSVSEKDHCVYETIKERLQR